MRRLIPRAAELRQTARALRRAPWYAASLAGVIALSLALATTAFAIVDGALFKRLPYRNPAQLFTMVGGWSQLQEPLRSTSLSPAQIQELRAGLPEAAISAFSFSGTQPSGGREHVAASRVDARFFEVLATAPLIGGFRPEDFQGDAGAVKPGVITYGFWQERFGGDPSAIGRSIVDDSGQGFRVVGILPPDFVFPFAAGGEFTPKVLTPLVDVLPRGLGRSLQALVRLEPSMTPLEAADRLTGAAARWAVEHPASAAPPGLPARTMITRQPIDRVGLTPIGAALTGPVSERAWIVFAASAGLVLLAALNAASLVVARNRDRWRELAVRRALGAGTAELLRLLALETAIVVAAGALIGIAAAAALLTVPMGLIGDSFLFVLKPPTIDMRVVGFALVAAAGSVALVTLLAVRGTRSANLHRTMAEGGGSTRRERGRTPIVSVQVAIALVMAVGATLVAGSLARVWREDPGFDRRDTALISVSQPRGASAADIEALIATIGRIPGVRRAGGVNHAMLEHAFNGSEFDAPPGIAGRPPGSTFPIESVPVTHGYLEAAGVELRRGRFPTDAEFMSGAPLIVVSDTVANHYWPGQQAIGQTLTNAGRPYTVVGVVADARYLSLDLDSQGIIYWPAAAATRPWLAYVVVRLDRDSPGVLDRVRNEITSRCPACWFRSAATMDDALADTIRPRRFSAWLFSAFGVSALVIVGTGILGLVAMTTKRRTREIGIRMTLGARPADVVRQILREQIAAVVIGLAAGGLLALWLVRFVATYTYKMSVYDPMAWASAIGVLVVIAALGALFPSLRASRVDPVRALRVD